jgi:hypothetical protein
LALLVCWSHNETTSIQRIGDIIMLKRRALIGTIALAIVLGLVPVSLAGETEGEVCYEEVWVVIEGEWVLDLIEVPCEEEPPPGGGEGCTPGYWKQPQHLDSWVMYSPEDSFAEVFGIYEMEESPTLLEALMAKGGKQNALMRHATAALLNAESSGVSYLYYAEDVMAMVQEAFWSGDFNGIKDMFEAENEAGCPLN